jgi:hypothetical protein
VYFVHHKIVVEPVPDVHSGARFSNPSLHGYYIIEDAGNGIPEFPWLPT